MTDIETVLLKSREGIKALFNGIPMPTYIWQFIDENLILLDFNSAAEEFAQENIASYLGIKAKDLYKDRPDIVEDLYICLKEKKSISREMDNEYQTVDERKYLSVKYGFIPPDLVLVHTEDITKKKELEENLKKSEFKQKERIKELICLYGISDLAIKPNITTDELLRGTLKLIPPSMQFPEIICAEIKYKEQIYRTTNFKETSWDLSTSITVVGNSLEIYVYYLEENIFAVEETHLLNDIANRLEMTIAKKDAEEKLKKLNLELENKIEERTKELKESEERLKIFMESAPNTFMLYDSDLNLIDINIIGIKRFPVGTKKEDIIGKNIVELSPDVKKKGRYDEYLEVIKTGKPFFVEEFISHPKFGNLYISLTAFKVLNGLGIIARNITERKKKETEIRLHSEIMTNLSEGVYLIRLDDGIIVFTNPRFEEMFGYDPDEMIGKDVAIVNAPTNKTPEGTKEEIMEILRETGEWHGEVKNIKKDGTHFWCYANVSLFDHPEYGRVFVSVHTDITERKKAEEKEIQKTNIMKAINEVFNKALTCESEEELGKTCLDVAQELSGAKFGFFGEVNSEGSFDTLAISNPGWDECTMPGSTATRLIKGMEIRGMLFLPLVDGKSRIFNNPSNHPDSVGTPEGHPIITSLLVVPFIYKGEIIGQIGLGNKEGGFTQYDLEAIETLAVAMIEALLRTRVEQQLIETLETTKLMLESLPVGIFLIGYDKKMKMVNKVALKLLGIDSEEEILDQYCYNHVCVAEKKLCPIIDLNKNIDDSERCIINKVGNRIPILKSVIPIRLGSDNLLLEAFLDITPLKEIQSKLEESEKQAHKSSKEANFYKDLFAHDINNILNGIKGASELYLLYEKDSTKLIEKHLMINIIKDQVIKGALLVSNVQKLSQLEDGKDVRLKEINVREIMNKAKKYIQESFQERTIKIDEDYFIKKPIVLANELLLDVFENLLNNAVKYNDSPIVKIQTKISRKIEKGKNYFKIEFIDNGIGIMDEKKEIIFKKGYKKEKGTKGMGFGLTLVKKLIKSYNGKIWVEDIVEGDYTQGSNFVVLIPEAI